MLTQPPVFMRRLKVGLAVYFLSFVTCELLLLMRFAGAHESLSDPQQKQGVVHEA